MSDAFQRKLETNVNKLIESYKTLLKKSSLEESHVPHESLVITTAAATIVSTSWTSVKLVTGVI